MARPPSYQQRLTFGRRVPWAVGLLLAITIITSLTVALGSRHVAPLLELGALSPDRVLHGEIWRLLTWAAIEPDIITLIFACLMLYWFGRDLADQWGSRRFLAVYGGIAVFAGVGTSLLALVDPALREQRYVGSWPLAEAITVAWGLWFPDRIIRIYFVIPIRGVIVAWGTVALTVGFAIFRGWDHYVPSLLSEGAMLGWLYRGPVVSRWTKWRREQELAARKARTRKTQVKKQEQRMATVHVLHQLEERDEDLPPLPPELESKIGKIISDAASDQRRKDEGEDK